MESFPPRIRLTATETAMTTKSHSMVATLAEYRPLTLGMLGPEEERLCCDMRLENRGRR